jgi:hypothetical protein
MDRCVISLAVSAALFGSDPLIAGMVPPGSSGQQSSWLNAPGLIRDTGFLPGFGYSPMLSPGGKGPEGSAGSGGGGGQGGGESGSLGGDSSQRDRSPFTSLPNGLFGFPTGRLFGSGPGPAVGQNGDVVASMPSGPVPGQNVFGLSDSQSSALNYPSLPEGGSSSAVGSFNSHNFLGGDGTLSQNGSPNNSNNVHFPGDEQTITHTLPGSGPISGPINVFGSDLPNAATGPTQPLGNGPVAGFGNGSGGPNNGGSILPNAAAVPEPASLILCCVGVVGLLGVASRRRSAKP